MPDLLQRNVSPGRNPRCNEVELVVDCIRFDREATKC